MLFFPKLTSKRNHAIPDLPIDQNNLLTPINSFPHFFTTVVTTRGTSAFCVTFAVNARASISFAESS